MKINTGVALLSIDLLAVSIILIDLFFPSTIVRVILGLPYVLFSPGFMLSLVLFPQNGKLDGVERGVFSFGFSIVIMVLMGLILNFTWWGIKLESILCSLTFFILVMSVISWLRMRGLAPEERFEISYKSPKLVWGETPFNKILSILMIISGLVILSAVGYVIFRPMAGEKYTEFYVLGADGNADNYPTSIQLGNSGHVIVGIINREGRETSYNITVLIDNGTAKDIGPVVLPPDGMYEKPIDITPMKIGDNQKVEMLLYRNEGKKPYSDLHLWLDVLP